MPDNQIIQLEKNTRGNDYIIGDVHGCNAGLRAVIEDLTAEDRLFLVGDLFDRGPDSVDVYHALMEAKNTNKKIYVTRGNHEDMLLKALPIFERFSHHPHDVLTASDKRAIYDCLRNGGSWIFSDPDMRDLYEESQFENTSFRDFVCNESIFKTPLREQLGAIQSFLSALPYVIVVGDLDDKLQTFIVCHADMPFDDETLRKRLCINIAPGCPVNQLGPLEIQHITWERPDQCQVRKHPTGRNEQSILVYCGHSILNKMPPYTTRAVRAETNHVNLDAGAFLTSHQMFLRMNHTRAKVDVFNDESQQMWLISEIDMESHLNREAAAIMQHVEAIRKCKEKAALNAKRIDLINQIKQELCKQMKLKHPLEFDVAMVELRLIHQNTTDLSTPLLTPSKITREMSIQCELAAMIRELERLVGLRTHPSLVWTPGELVTKPESYCCFFLKKSTLNLFYDQVVNLGGIPISSESNEHVL